MKVKERHKEYYEGILQLRNPGKTVFDYINKKLAENPSIRIVKEKKLKNGLDLYFNDKRFLKNLGEKLKNRFNAHLKTSAKLFSVDRQTGKELYRLTVLIRIPNFEAGQIISLQGKLMQVLEIKNKVRLKEVKTGKKYLFDFDYVNERMKNIS